MKHRRILSAFMAAVLTIGTVGPTLPTAAAEGEVQQFSEEAQTIEGYEEPAEEDEESAESYEEPAVYEEPAESYEEPAEVYEEPVEAYGEPDEVYEEPAEVYEEPAEVYEEPVEIPAEVPSEEPDVEPEEPAPEMTEAQELPQETYAEPQDSALIADDGVEIAVPVVNNGEIIIEDAEWIEEDLGGDPEDDEDETDEFGIEIEAITEDESEDEIMTLAAGETGAFAVYSEDDSSLTFYYGEEPEEGTEYNNKTATNVYTGFDTTVYSSYSSVPWYSNRTNFASVTFDETFAGVTPAATAYWFYGFTSCTSMNLSNLNTSAVTDMTAMFRECSSLKALDVSGFDTSGVTTMRYMFRECSSLTTLDVSGFNTAGVANMQYMFYGCSKLTTIYSNDENFVTTAVTSGSSMFTSCSNLVGGNGTKYSSSTGSTYTMAHVDTEENPGYFTNESVKYDPAAFAVYSADDNSLTFYYANPVPVEGEEYNDEIVTNVYTDFDKSTYSGSSSTPWYSNRKNVKEVVFDESFSAAKPKAMAYWFQDFSNAEFSGFENVDTSQVTTMVYTFASCSSFTNTEGMSGWDTSNVTSMQDMFYYCTSLTSLDISSWDASKVTSMAQMFYGCSKLTYLNVSGLVTSGATEINGMLRDLTALTELDLSGWDTSSVTKINALFRLDSALKTIYVDEDWDLSSLGGENDRKNLFYNCTALVGGNGTVWNSGQVDYDMAHIDTADNPGYFTNVKVLDTVEISETKVWDDADDQDGIRPESITVNLYNGEELTDSMTVTAEDDWSFTFSDEPKYDENLEEIHYTITEDAVDEYDCVITGDMEDGFVITNTHTPGKADVSGTITWEDGNNQDGKRPNFVSVQLFAKDEEGGILGNWDFEVHAPEDPVYDSDGNEVWTWTQENLDLYYNGGKEVKYTVVYTVTNLADGYTQYNPNDLDTIYSYTPETTTISGSKTWADMENVEETRPDSITVRLHANGNEKVYDQTVTAADGWSWTFEDVPVYSDGQRIDYTITEDAVENYYPIYDGWNITNTLDRGNTSITVMKDWEDANDQDGRRPESITVSLWANEADTGKTLTLSEENNWEDDFHGLAIDDENGNRITYTITEETFSGGYDTEISGNVSEGFVITNSYTPEIIKKISGVKTWVDADNQDGKRPSSIYVHLLADGEAVDDVEVKPDGNGDWTFGFIEVPKYADGTEIEYTVEEVLASELADVYDGEVSGDVSEGFTITNTNEPEMLNDTGTLTVTKVWDDDDNRDGLRPQTVIIHLLADGTEISHAEFSNVDGSVEFTDLPRYANGKEISYTVTEDSVEGYTAAVTGSAEEGYTITNTHSPETIRVDVEKIWDDAEDQDGKRPASVTIRLLADGDSALDQNGNAITAAMNEEDGWDWSFWNLYRYRDGGTEIVYTVEEDTTGLEGIYDASISGDMYEGFNVTNSYEPEFYNGDGTFKVVLIWDDDANNDGIRPEEVNVKLTKNDTTVDGAEMTLTAQEVDDDGNWTGTFTGLPKYENGSEIKYAVKEDVKSGYTYRVELLTDDEGKTYVQLTNVHVSVTEDIEVTKIWDDADDQDGKRPKYITLRLLTNGNLYKEEDLYADTEGVKVSENGDVWTYTMRDIPVDKNGKAIEYTMLEVDVDNYGTPVIVTIRGDEVTDNGVTYQPYSFEVTNSHTSEQVTVSGTKVWDDADNQDGKRPQYVTLHLYADDEWVEDIDVSTDDATEEDSNVWAWSFGSYDKYADGEEIEYTVREDPAGAEDAGYSTVITGSVEDGFTVTNSYTPETTTIFGSKTWFDEDGAEEYRPESITVRLHANGNEEVYEQTVREEDGWAWEFVDVPVYSNGYPITYTLTEDALDNYDVEYTHGADGSLNVTNTLDPGNTSVTVEKDWEDAEDQDGIRPEEIIVELFADGNETGETLTLSEDNYWEDTFHHLLEYDNGARINYTVQEVSVGNYVSDIDGDAAKGFTITNTHTPETISISGSKVWEDNNDQDGIRPDHITVHLMNGEETLESHTVNAENDWTFKFSDLDKYANGEEIVYTIEEAYTAEGYEAAVEGYTITNSHTPEKIDITGTKTWDDDDDRDGIRPQEIMINLYAGEELAGSESVSADDSWTYTFTDFDRYAGGEEIDYSVKEEVPEGYHASYNYFDYDVTNIHSPELFNGDGTLGVIMRWEDEEDQDGLRPKRTTITLTLNGKPDETITLVLSDDNVDENGNWIGSFTDLYQYADGEEIEYNVEEGVMNGYTYTAELMHDEDTGLWYIEITNTHAAVTSDITVTKVWDDNDNQDGIRPEQVVVNLFSNDSAVKSVTIRPGKEGVTVSADGNEWSYTFENMPVDQNGGPIIYTLDEVDVGSYSHEIETRTEEGKVKDGVKYTEYAFTVTNTHTPETAEVIGEKIWDDADDQDGIRPDSITIELLADGQPALDENNEEITQQVTPQTDGSWTWTFTGIPKYRDAGTEIVYSFEEVEVEGYETSYSADGLTVTNTHIPETRTISGDKIWEDNDDQYEARPENITVNLYKKGILYDSQTISEADGWAWTFKDLPVYEGGQRITYVTTETAIDDYVTTYSGFTLTNTYVKGKTSLTVAADWEDDDDQEGRRPASITITLLADGSPALDEAGEPITLTLTDDGNGIWEGTFTELAEYSGNTRISYSIGQVSVDGYDCTIEGDEKTGYSLIFTLLPELFNGDGILEISVDWEDEDDADHMRPESITILLKANGEEIGTVTLSADNNWTAAFYNLLRYDEDGQEIEYTAVEADIDGYDCEAELKQDSSGRYYLEIVNTHEVEETTPQTSESESESKQTEPETKQTEPKTKQTESETKQTEPKTKQTESETKQTESETKQTESGTKQTESGTKQTESKKKETESKEKETEPAAEKPASETSSSILLLRGTAKSKTKIDLDWTKVKGADGYILYSAKCGEKFQKTAVIEGRKNRTYTVKKLEPKTSYKFYVKAYKIVDGKRVTIQKSNKVHLYTKGKGGKYTNVKKVKVSTKNVKLRVGDKKKVKASVKLVKSSRKLMEHTNYIHYISSDTSVAKVNSKGRITAVGKGTCYVYAYAADGARKKIKVTVKKAK